MLKSSTKCYAVRIGREGPKIYETWDECKANVARFPGAVHKSFKSVLKAQEWLHTPGIAPFAPTPNVAHKKQDTSAKIQGESSRQSFGIVLSREQKKVLQLVKDGRNVFFTGSAGTGKSVLLREIIRTFRAANPLPPTPHDDDIRSSLLAITAPTGIAAVNIGGTTIHSWAGIGLGMEDALKLAKMLLGRREMAPVLRRWCEVKMLIIDEISMMDGVLFDKLECIARHLRDSTQPFGGIQLVLSGDFFQLPPVSPRGKNGKQIESIFAFDAESWNNCIGSPIMLKRVFRQKDQAFIDMLNAMRFGRLDTKTLKAFEELSRPVEYVDGIEPSELFPTRRQVDYANNSRINKLPKPEHIYTAFQFAGSDGEGRITSKERMTSLLERLIVPLRISLRVGAQVMLVKNIVQGELVNGSIGQVVGFKSVREVGEDKIAITRDEKQISPEDGQAQLTKSESVWPLVKFTNGREMLCVPVDFTVNNTSGGIEAGRSQVPLILAWALSIHKSQGQTLERVKVDLGATFEKGQAYVALSRATSMQSLQVLRFSPEKVMVHPRVISWYTSMEGPATSTFDDPFDELDCEIF